MCIQTQSHVPAINTHNLVVKTSLYIFKGGKTWSKQVKLMPTSEKNKQNNFRMDHLKKNCDK